MGKPDTQNAGTDPISVARICGRVALGLCLGIALLPAILELLAIAGSVSAFKYQGF